MNRDRVRDKDAVPRAAIDDDCLGGGGEGPGGEGRGWRRESVGRRSMVL